MLLNVSLLALLLLILTPSLSKQTADEEDNAHLDFSFAISDADRPLIQVYSNFRYAYARLVLVRDTLLDMDPEMSLAATQEADEALLSMFILCGNIFTNVINHGSDQGALMQDLYNIILTVPKTLYLIEQVFKESSSTQADRLRSEARTHLQKAFGMVQAAVQLSNQVGSLPKRLRRLQKNKQMLYFLFVDNLPGPVYPNNIIHL